MSPPSPTPHSPPPPGSGRIWTPKAGITPQADLAGLACPFPTLHPTAMGGLAEGHPFSITHGCLRFCCREMHPSMGDMGKLRHRAHFGPGPNSNPLGTKWQRSFPANGHHSAGGGGRGWSPVPPRPRGCLEQLTVAGDSCPVPPGASPQTRHADGERSPSPGAPRHHHALPQPPPRPLRPGR